MEIKTKLRSTKIFDNDLVATHKKNNTTLTLKKPAYVGRCIPELSKIPMRETH